jgi:hypothetical protein
VADDSSLDITDAITLMAWAKDPPAWLTGWDYRRKITIDSDKIDADLTDFPLLIALSDTCGMSGQDLTGIFSRIGANSKKIALTTSDGTTQCYVEIEKWDNTNQEAWLWARIPSISSSSDTELYLYYDNNHADNTTYIGNTNEAAADSVWNDSKYVGVWHMADGASTSAIYDSTPNDFDGTKKGANEPNEYAGEIDGSQDFDGIDDYIGCGDVITEPKTISLWFYNDSEITTSTSQQLLIDTGSTGIGLIYSSVFLGSATGAYADELITIIVQEDPDISNRISYVQNGGTIPVGWHNLVIIDDPSAPYYYYIWLDNVSVANKKWKSYDLPLESSDVIFGDNYLNSPFDGKITDVKIISDIVADEDVGCYYYSESDSLNTFAAEELEPVTKYILNKDAYYIQLNTTDAQIIGYTGTSVVYDYEINILEYHLYALTYDKTNIKLYLDGVQVASQAYTTAISTNDSTLTIGKAFTGEIDDVQIYNRALSADEIWSYYTRRVEDSNPYVWQNGDAELNSISLPNITAGTDNSVVIADSDDILKTDEIDPLVWDNDLIEGSGTANHIPYYAESDSLANTVIEYAGDKTTFNQDIDAETLYADSINVTGGVTVGGDLGVTGALTSATLDTGQGANELYDMNQDVKTTNNVTFNTVTSTTQLIGNGLTLTEDTSVGSGTIKAGTTSLTVANAGCKATDFIFLTCTKPSGTTDILDLFVDALTDSFIVYTDNADTLATDIPFNWLRVSGE